MAREGNNKIKVPYIAALNHSSHTVHQLFHSFLTTLQGIVCTLKMLKWSLREGKGPFQGHSEGQAGLEPSIPNPSQILPRLDHVG